MSESSATLISSRQPEHPQCIPSCSDVKAVKAIIEILLERKVTYDDDDPCLEDLPQSKLQRGQCEFQVTDSIWDLFVQLLKLRPWIDHVPQLCNLPDDLALFKDQMVDLNYWLEFSCFLEFNLDRHWLGIHIIDHSGFNGTLEHLLAEYIVTKMERFFDESTMAFIIRTEEAGPMMSATKYLYPGTPVYCDLLLDQHMRQPPLVMIEVGFSIPVKPERVQDCVSITEGRTQFILCLNIEYVPPTRRKFKSPSNPPKSIHLQIWSSRFDDSLDEWKAYLVADITDLRTKVDCDPDAGFDLSPEIAARHFDDHVPAPKMPIFISYKFLLCFISKAWVETCCGYVSEEECEEKTRKRSFSLVRAEEFNKKRRRCDDNDDEGLPN
ncbi:uncharacterized protein GGS22DRAFT_148829 [Annulohypoxylon maeteangense]|uniref:uncharacterized protein n=1 Tax=Annulohypoxylon maeteangense TaxID=1927788 RepID=UPI002008BEE5|nr:uncharacterized protein GGS22DRAFT_148829 [Annulohypoxylon maeteangense]KAI0889652.1 hypothetical protein GGS22DRAFT_148829 [Annulohypoxylon maeteangense]